MRISTLVGLLLAAAPGIVQAQCNPSATVQAALDEVPARFLRSTRRFSVL
jgi:hypothetical protein